MLHHSQEQARCLFHKTASLLSGVSSHRQDACATKHQIAGGVGIPPAVKKIICGTKCDFEPSMTV
ncbi:MAG: hypothetical protein LH628_03365 [Microcoleus sp. CAN_BIN18]|jgi:hypothetical protein|nr:hypothetical protein [Microcoleus sp. CAN_BIN18]